MFQRKVSLFAKAAILDHPILIGGGAEARQGKLHFFKWNHVFFSMTLLPILGRIQRPTTQGHFRHAKYENSRKIETYRNNHFQRIH